MGGKSGGTIGYKYFMSLHIGLCRGPVDEVVAIWADDKEAYPKLDSLGVAQTPIVDNTETEINAENLFGGEEKEGGLKGRLQPLFGAADQVVPDWIKTIMGGRVPAFRGVTTFFFDGMICAMNPYPKPWKFRVRRTFNGWDGPVFSPGNAAIPLVDGKIKASNAAHMIYEAATNRSWGRGLPRSFIDEASWIAAAETLKNENFGMCLRWNRQDTLQSFVGQVLTHIGGVVYVDRTQGLLTLKLLRKDYVTADLPLFDYNSGLIEITESENSRETLINEVIVTYRNPLTRKDGQVRVQDLASIQSFGGAMRSSTVEYLGVPTAKLALRLAERDMAIGISGAKRYKVKLDRRAWKIPPGAAFRVTAPDKGINDIVLRAGPIRNPPTGTVGPIEVDATLDVFGLSDSSFIDEQEPTWTPPSTAAHPVTTRIVREVNRRELARELPAADLDIVDPTSGLIGVAARRPAGGLDLNFSIFSKISGSPKTYKNRGTGDWCPVFQLGENIGPYTTTFHYVNFVDYQMLDTITLNEDGATLEMGGEIMRVDAIDMVAQTVTVARGCVDTVPQSHLAGVLGYFTDEATGYDELEYSEGEIVSVKLRTNTSGDKLPLGSAPVDDVPIVARQNRPYPPGNVKANGADALAGIAAYVGDVLFAWSHRNRLTQGDKLYGHEVSSITPEPGTTYTVVIKNGATVLRTTTDISGNNWTYTDAMALADGAPANYTVELWTVRDGYASFTKHIFVATKSPVIFFDDFERADGDPGVNYTRSGAAGGAMIVGGKISTNNLTSAPAVTYSRDTGSNNHFVEALFLRTFSAESYPVAVRITNNLNYLGATYYSGRWRIYTNIAGVSNNLASLTEAAPTGPRTVRLQIDGANLVKFFVNGVQKISVPLVGALPASTFAGFIARDTMGALIDSLSIGRV